MSRTIGQCMILAFMTIATFVCLAGQAWAGKKIAILLWTKENHYLESLNGVMDQLRKGGYGEPAVEFITENAEGNKAQAAEIVKKFAAAKPDLYIAIGTTAASIVSRLVQDVPIVFSMVFNPVESEIVNNWKSSGNNVTGASNKVSLAVLVKTLKEAAPVKTLAVLYEPRESNAEAQLKELQAEQNAAQIKVVPVPITSKMDINLIVPEAAATVDAMFIAGSGILGEMVPEIVEIARKKHVITATHLSPRVENGVLIGVCSNPFAVGVMAGERTIKILQGTKPVDIPIGTQANFDILINMKTAKAGNFQIPAAFLKKADRVIQ